MQIVSSIVYFISISYKTPKFHVFVVLVGAWIGEKWKKKGEEELKMQRFAFPSTLGDPSNRKVLTYVTASDP